MIVSEQPFYFKATVKLLLLGLVLAFLIIAKDILIPFTLAVFFTFLLLPVSRKLEHWHFPKALAILTSIVLSLAILVALLYFFFSQVMSFVNDWPVLEKALTAKIEGVQQFIRDTFHISNSEQKMWVTTILSGQFCFDSYLCVFLNLVSG